VIGCSFLQYFKVGFDYKNKIIQFSDPDKSDDVPQNGTRVKLIHSSMQSGWHQSPRFTGMLEGRPCVFLIDTGFADHLPVTAVNDKLPSLGRIDFSKEQGRVGQSHHMNAHWMIGRLKGRMAIYFDPRPKPICDVILGNSFLKDYKVTLNLRKEYVDFTPIDEGKSSKGQLSRR
jgi:hypothetical protein